MIRVTFLASLCCFALSAAAQSCWRNTACTGPQQPAFPGPWEASHFSPSSRTVSPKQLFPLNDTSSIKAYPTSYTLAGNASAVVYDFGIEVGGILTVKYNTDGESGKLEIGRAHV